MNKPRKARAGARGSVGPSGEPSALNRRTWLRIAGAGVACGLARAAEPEASAETGVAPAGDEPPAVREMPTRFQVACMTLPYAKFPLQRALTGIQGGGVPACRLGYNPCRGGWRRDADLGRRCRARPSEGTGQALSRPGPGTALDVLGHLPGGQPCPGRPAAADPSGRGRWRSPGTDLRPHRGGNRKLWVERFKQLGPMARDHGVTIVVKQHGGETGTGAACAEIVREVDDAGIKVNYDAGNVMDYLDVDPIPDLRTCAPRSDRSASRTIATRRATRIAARASARSTTTSCSAWLPSPAGQSRSAARTSSPRSCLDPAPRPTSTPWRASLANTSSW